MVISGEENFQLREREKNEFHNKCHPITVAMSGSFPALEKTSSRKKKRRMEKKKVQRLIRARDICRSLF